MNSLTQLNFNPIKPDRHQTGDGALSRRQPRATLWSTPSCRPSKCVNRSQEYPETDPCYGSPICFARLVLYHCQIRAIDFWWRKGESSTIIENTNCFTFQLYCVSPTNSTRRKKLRATLEEFFMMTEIVKHLEKLENFFEVCSDSRV